MALFGGKSSGSGNSAGAAKIPRHSSGWSALAKHLRGRESLRILDIGPTSAGNINFITSLGHSVYMANLVEDAAKPDYIIRAEEGSEGPAESYDVERYLADNLNFSGRQFDVVTLWDTMDYLPEPLITPVVERLHQVIAAGGWMLAFFHAKSTGDDTAFSRYHLTSTDQLDVQRLGTHPIRRSYTNRQIEQVFSRFSNTKFFLAKDALREVIIVQ